MILYLLLDEIESTDMKHLKKPPDAPKKKMKQLTSNKTVDKLIHTIIDYILRDFIDDWFLSVSDNNDFSLETRTIIENFIINFTKRIQQTPLVSIMTTKLIDDIAMHAKKYRQASQIVKESRTVQNITKSPTKFNPPLHRRNKSETDVTWNIGSANIQRNVANSTFFSVQTDEKLLDPEKQLLEVFFENFQGLYKEESTSDEALQRHLTSVIETILYFTMQRNDFNCDSLRLLVSTLLANVLCKSIDAMSDPDFINLQIAHNFSVEPPAAEFLIKMIRQTNDLSELRSVRQLLTREMDSKYKDPNTISGELASLKFTQKIIDIRISSIQNNRIDMSGKKLFERDRTVLKVPQLPLDEILTKELALSYYLDYLSILNLQKYVIFYLLAQDWKFTVSERLTEASNDESQRMQILKHYRDKAFEMYRDYLIPSSVNYLNIDPGLIEVIHIRIKDTFIQPEVTWFDSICKFVYEKLKNEDVFLQNFYQSSAYKKLLVELEESEVDQPEVKLLENQESESDSNSGDFLIDDMDFLEQCEVQDSKLLNPHIHRHHRSHSDTGVINLKAQSPSESNGNFGKRLQAKIINSAINSDGKFAVYAIQVTVIEQDPDGSHQQKSWHIYRRYSKFLELKKFLVRRFVQFQQIQLPFPKKQTFHNTNRSVLERRMMILNEFLMVICDKAGADDSLNVVIRDFLEPDQDDRQIHGTKVIRHIVNPIKSGMKTIKSMPDTVFGGFSRIFMAKNVNKLPFDEIDGHSSDYPSLVSFVSLLDAVFDLESRSQWLKKGIQRLLGAPWVSQSVNRKIQETAQRLIEPDKVEAVLNGILSNIWPDGIHKDPVPREDNTKLRTRMAAKIVLFTFFSGN